MDIVNETKGKRILIMSDHQCLMEAVYRILVKKQIINDADFGHSSQVNIKSSVLPDIQEINVRRNTKELKEKYCLILSLHCKQIFPAELIRNIRCINIHPGFNPYNRGWYPHVFSIINKLPAGVTIHEMDEQIDHGHVIAKEEVPVFSYDTSETLYSRILDTELKLLEQNIEKLIKNDYHTFEDTAEGNINTKKDFERIREIDLKKMYKGRELIDLLRALSHDDYQNAYFLNEDNRKVFVKIALTFER